MNSRRKEFMGDSKINVDLWPAGLWSENELENFKNLVAEFGSTSGQLSSRMRGIEPQTVIAFVTGAVAAGLFGELGSDLYKYLRDELKRLLLKRRRKNAEGAIGRLSFSYEEDGIGLYAFYTCIYSNEKDLDVLFSSLHPFNSFIGSACSKSLFPFDEGQQYDIHAILEFDRNPKWNVRIRRYSMEQDKLVLNEFFQANLEIDKLKESEWEKIEWDYQERLLID
jgi:hypothetical protein